MSEQEMWEAFEDKKENDSYQAWAYGESPDELAQLTLDGIKTATSSAYALYENEPLPQVGEYSIILDSHNQAVCIIQTTAVEIKPFCEVDATHAYLEGEGDRTLAYWQSVHRSFFEKEMQANHQTFDEKMLVVCEKFQVVYPK
ncbi:ASCH domain-containing protein [Allocoprobacillus halotolerans]|uniref:ASCH domain-containing protein n=1 Tax=Allocoprobacillus halotolerans TaxID=2944914 RepID=A0ABY5HYD3_9FIRM|nr:ASCH domain-containing protein [Allocoprobacillus halotolerans]UTY38046.1 ASCH domain-containing protein [Allocoprobacillus halotolerans]